MKAALWDWRSDPVPDARLVVARPAATGLPFAAYVACAPHIINGGRLVVCGGRFWGEVAPAFIPALHVERQADIERLPMLLAVKAERRALVVSPREAVDLGVDMESTRPLGMIGCSRCHGFGVVRGPRIDREGFNEELACPDCDGARTLIDLIVIAGFDEPIHPAHVRSLVEQGRAAGVPVVFAGWGSWVTLDQLSEEAQDRADLGGETRGSGKVEEPFWYRVGAARSGALLDGETICDLPEWLGGEA